MRERREGGLEAGAQAVPGGLCEVVTQHRCSQCGREYVWGGRRGRHPAELTEAPPRCQSARPDENSQRCLCSGGGGWSAASRGGAPNPLVPQSATGATGPLLSSLRLGTHCPHVPQEPQKGRAGSFSPYSSRDLSPSQTAQVRVQRMVIALIQRWRLSQPVFGTGENGHTQPTGAFPSRVLWVLHGVSSANREA